MRRAHGVDVNQKAIVEALRAAGRVVEVLFDVGRGVPDLLVTTPSGRMVGVEVKRPGDPLTPCEMEWHSKRLAAVKAGTLVTVETAQAAIEATR